MITTPINNKKKKKKKKKKREPIILGFPGTEGFPGTGQGALRGQTRKLLGKGG
jgi:hypothetical protein